MFARTIRPVIKNAVVLSENTSLRVRAYHEPAHMKATTFNDLPVPQGSWQTDYSAKQAKYNIRLIAGILFSVGSLVVAKASGLFVFNMSPPSLKKE